MTATRRAQRLEDIPASVNVITGARLNAAETLNGAEDATRYLSGVEAAVANGSQIAFQIRGIGAVDHQALTPTAAAVYADGVFLATNVQTSLFLYDLDRIEVLKGPQGTLYGRNASSGAINFLTARPSQDQHSYLRASYGRFDRIDLAGAVGTVLTDRLSARIAGRYLSEEPTLDNVQSDPAIPRGPEDAGGVRDEFGLRASLLYELDDDAALLLRGHYEEDNGVNATPLNDSLDLGKHEISSEGDGVQNTDNAFFGASLEGTAQLSRWSLYSLTAFEGYTQDYGFDFDGTPAPFGVPSLNANLHYDRDFRQVSEELRAQTEIGRVNLLIGAHGAWEDFSQDYLIWCGQLDPDTLLGTCPYVGAAGRVGPAPASPGTALSLLTHIEQTRETFALFTHNDIALDERLTLTLGGRYTYENIEGDGYGLHFFDDGAQGFNNRDSLGPAIGENRIEENRFTGNAALRYAFSDETSVYASFSSGYKSGGFNGEVQNNAAHWSDEGLFGAETVKAYELGLKTRAGDDFAFNAALFFQDYNDPQARIFVDFPLPDGGRIISNSLSNLDAAVSYGFDADGSWSPARGLDLAASFTWLATEINQESDAAGNAALFDGNPLPFAPELSGTVSARYEWRLAQQMRAAVQANAKAKSAFYLDAEGLAARRQGAYATLDASATLYLDAVGLELSLWGRNLTDRDVAVSGYGFIGYNTFRSAPLSYGVSAQLSF
ncbi:TonB-dependent receptor [Hyphococcus luteus]|uniref:TonB-dependent receptor n=1 Tax=Hyphococcus luteus TaxID=2058213 RepID=UPI001A9C6321|nr:TonB-dependent receptor [Marinicaulis flavus]